MTRASDDISVKPEVTLLGDLLAEVAAGRLRIPRFQRPFVWRPEQMLSLFDSIERGYPIGSLLVWDTTEDIPSLDSIAEIPVPEPGGWQPVSYVLDGHQRLSTLFGALMRPKSQIDRDDADWRWHIYRDLGLDEPKANKFRHWRYDQQPPIDLLPTRSILRTMDFLGYARDVHNRTDSAEEEAELIDEAEQVAQRIKSYKVSVVRLVGGTLAQAVEVFSRLNSSGQSMTPDQMVSALAYRGGSTESLADQIDEIQNAVSSTGFGEIPSITIFRSILAVAGEEDVQEARWEALALRVQDRLKDAVAGTEVALFKAVEFLKGEIGAPIARLVPYNAQIMLLTAFFHFNQHLTIEQVSGLRRWFWSTSWSGSFAGANTTQIRNSLAEMREFSTGYIELDLTGQTPRGFPRRFDSRSARVRTLLLWELNAFPEPVDVWGVPVDLVRSLEASDTHAYRRIVSQKVENAVSPANRVIMPTSPGVSIRNAMARLTGQLAEDVCRTNGIPFEALERLQYGDDEGFIRVREEFLASHEREFMRKEGVGPSSYRWDEAYVDTE